MQMRIWDKRYNKFVVNISILIIGILFSTIQAQSLPSQIDRDTTLSLDGSPYIAGTSLSVNDGVKLTVEAGVEIRFAAGASLTILGECEMAGTDKDPIKLIPQNSLNYWSGVKGSTGYIEFNNVLVSNATTAYSINYGVIKLSNCEIRNISGSDAIHINGPDTAIVNNTYMLGERQLSKQDAIDCDNAGQGLVLFEDNTFAEYSDDAIDVGNQSYNVIIRGNKINHCVSMGITVGEGSKALVERNIVINCNGGIEVHNNASATILNNTLYHNNTGIFGYHASDSGTPTSGASAEIINTIISECQTQIFSAVSNSNLEFRYSISDTDTLPGEMNLLEPVQFIDANNLDFRLRPTSPCVDRGDPTSYPDDDGSPADMGAIPYWETGNIVINEILYQNQFDTTESVQFIELLNISDQPIDLQQYKFSGNIDNIFTESVLLHPDSFLVITNDLSSFHNNAIIQWQSGTLDSSGMILLEDNQGNIVDFVDYDSESPWPVPELDMNKSLELINSSYKNAFAENWLFSINNGGTPGYLNSITFLIDQKIINQIDAFELYQNYPNPFNPKTVIRYTLPIACQIDLSIYNILGQKVISLVSEKQDAGNYTAEWNASEFAGGIYFYRLVTETGYISTRKLLLVK